MKQELKNRGVFSILFLSDFCGIILSMLHDYGIKLLKSFLTPLPTALMPLWFLPAQT
jgi:hypothetical protein